MALVTDNSKDLKLPGWLRGCARPDGRIHPGALPGDLERLRRLRDAIERVRVSYPLDSPEAEILGEGAMVVRWKLAQLETTRRRKGDR